MRIAALCLGAMLIHSSPVLAQAPVSEWQVELTKLDNQIQDLSLKIDSSRHKALDAEANAQRVMMSDFAKYSDLIKQAEQYDEQTRSSESQLKLLLDQRKAFIRAHTNSPTPSR